MKVPNSIRDIIVKAVAKDIRKLFPSLRIEGHPSYSSSKGTVENTVALLVITLPKTKNKISVRLAKLLKRSKDLKNLQAVRDDEMMATAKICKDGNWLPFHGSFFNISAGEVAHYKKLDLVQPDSIDELEEWIVSLIETYFLVRRKKPASRHHEAGQTK